jgi:hypothetical protein
MKQMGDKRYSPAMTYTAKLAMAARTTGAAGLRSIPSRVGRGRLRMFTTIGWTRMRRLPVLISLQIPSQSGASETVYVLDHVWLCRRKIRSRKMIDM